MLNIVLEGTHKDKWDEDCKWMIVQDTNGKYDWIEAKSYQSFEQFDAACGSFESVAGAVASMRDVLEWHGAHSFTKV